ncbi:hypothetical protein ROJ8625_01721 [Roseivivax jejudonensis]|uniref:Uncharacterized protein n=1 Tax=Roseivivax jejudonensis TaxID=1529041 RepID=A0A1X6Z0X7_9RHOB|nr:hypothetical protein [Roseivivax jejudonensis]SLN37602.1 hypothetical protein ROJ8625_01721 [Roseivivax jejudonensis]
MVFELVAVVLAGVAGAGLMLLASRLLGERVPRWLVPVAAGGAMLAAAISNEYGWYDRTRGSLPDGMVVASAVEGRHWWRPWTYAVPMVERFVVVDAAGLRANAQDEGLYLADLYFFGRWRATQALQVMVDCEDGRRADPAGGDGGEPVWREVGADDPIVASVCAAAA